MNNNYPKMYLKNWEIHKTPYGVLICGNIYNDIHNRFEDGLLIITNRVKSINFDKKTVRTKNNKYNLE